MRNEMPGFILTIAIGSLLALSGCQTSKHAQKNEPITTIASSTPAEPAAAAPEAQPPPAAPVATPPSKPPAARPQKQTNPNAGAPPEATSHPAAPAPAPNAAMPPAATPAPNPSTLDLNSLTQRLRDTKAIGVFTKLSLKNQVDDLLNEFRAYHKGSAAAPPSDMRQKYDLLMLKVLSLLQNGDPQLASAIASSREAIWGILMDPVKFSKI
jgi:type IV secretory pathway VirB10-like protein